MKGLRKNFGGIFWIFSMLRIVILGWVRSLVSSFSSWICTRRSWKHSVGEKGMKSVVFADGKMKLEAAELVKSGGGDQFEGVLSWQLEAFSEVVFHKCAVKFTDYFC